MRFSISILLAATMSMSVPVAGSAESTADVVGTWILVSSVTEKDGAKTEQFGASANGMLMLDRGGHFMLTIIGSDLPKFVSNNRATGTPDENKAVVSKSIAMIGVYLITPNDKLTFKVENTTFPNWKDTEQLRNIVTLNGNELKYVTPTASSGGVGTVTWRRAR